VQVSVEGNESLIPTKLDLYQNYPNPFNPGTSIRYDLPEKTLVRVSVYSLLGEEIASLVDAVQAPSSHTVVWNGKDRRGMEAPSGMYLIRLQAGQKQIVRKAMLVR
jgi:hypothetical protein